MPLPSDGNPTGVSLPRTDVILGRYRVERALGEGGMGQVALALDLLLNRRVALKRLLPAGADQANLRSAILREARRASQINDPHVASIYDVLDLENEIVLVMEYVDGTTLRQRMNGPVPLDVFWQLAPQCVAGIAAAHARGVIHRDIKPENLMVTPDDQVKILDFGIAKRANEVDFATTASTAGDLASIAGTPQYMAPEAHLGGSIDARTDVFSLGAVFYEMLTGVRPFDGPNYATVVHRALSTEPAAISELNPAVGPGLSRMVGKMLAKDPAGRFATAGELMLQLGWAREEMGPPPVRDRSMARRAHHRARAPAAWVFVAGALVAVAAVALGLWRTLAPQALPGNRNLTVLIPAASSPGDAASMTLGFVDILNRRLHRHVLTPGFQMTSTSDFPGEDVRSVSDAHKILGVNLVLVPTLEQETDVMRARLDLVDAVRNRVIGSRRIQVPVAEPFALLDRSYRAAAALLGLVPHTPDAATDIGIRGAGTLRFYLQGTGKLRLARTADDARAAAEDFEVACKAEPEAAAARAALAAAQLRLFALDGDPEDLARAEASAREAVLLDTMRAEAHLILGFVFAAEKNQAQALAQFARASSLDPTDDDACLRLARTYAHLGQPEREKQTYLAAIARRPHGWQPYWWLATWHFRQGNVDESIRAYEAMVQRTPDLFTGYASLGGVLVMRGSYRSAIDTLKLALALRPDRVAFDNLGTAYFNSGRFEDAIAAYNQSLQFGNAGYLTWLNLGDAYYWLRNQREAAGAYRQSVRLGHDEMLSRAKGGHSLDVMIPANLATVFPKLGEPDSARAYLAMAIAADSLNPIVDYCAALTWWQLGDRSQAIAWLGRSVRGGYPTVWLRDSPIFAEWRSQPEFRALVTETSPRPQSTASPN